MQVCGFFGSKYELVAPPHLVLLGGGTGTVPLVGLALAARAKKIPVTLAISQRPSEPILTAELDRCRELGAEVIERGEMWVLFF